MNIAHLNVRKALWRSVVAAMTVLPLAGPGSSLGPSCAGAEETPEEGGPMRARVRDRAAYWTPERYGNAKPRYVPRRPVEVDESQTLGGTFDAPLEESVGEDARYPVNGAAAPITLFEPRHVEPDAGGRELDVDQPMNVGTSLLPFTSSRLIPQSADRQWPYKTVGKLFYNTPQGPAVCSAAVIRHRLIVTAGHCVHEGRRGRQGWFSDFRFVPAFRSGKAPFGNWRAYQTWTTSSWYYGGGSTPNRADFAIIELRDKTVNGRETRIGDRVGWLGFQTNRLRNNHVHMLGYPSNLDNGQKMHQVAAEAGFAVSPNNYAFGSDMGSGASGGPWVQNFGKKATGQSRGNRKEMNRVVGVTSAGRANPNDLSAVSSVLNNEFMSMYESACTAKTRNCSGAAR